MNKTIRVITSCFIAIVCAVAWGMFANTLSYIGPRWDWTTGASQLGIWSLIFGMVVVSVGSVFGILKIVGFFDDEEEVDQNRAKGERKIAVQPFNVNKYLSRIESETDKLLAQPKEPYETILWAGLDGLKINADGSTKWIKKHTENAVVSTQQRAATARRIKANGIGKIQAETIQHLCKAIIVCDQILRLDPYDNETLEFKEKLIVDLNAVYNSYDATSENLFNCAIQEQNQNMLQS